MVPFHFAEFQIAETLLLLLTLTLTHIILYHIFNLLDSCLTVFQ